MLVSRFAYTFQSYRRPATNFPWNKRDGINHPIVLSPLRIDIGKRLFRCRFANPLVINQTLLDGTGYILVLRRHK